MPEQPQPEPTSAKNGAAPPTGPWQIEQWPIERLLPYERNPRVIPQKAIDKVAASLRRFDWQHPIIVSPDGVILAGHTRLQAAKQLGMTQVPVRIEPRLSPADARAFRIADNRTAEETSFNDPVLAEELAALMAEDFPLEATGFDQDEIDRLLGKETGISSVAHGALAERFGVPPFSVLNAREGWWQQRKQAWIDLGIESDLGRGDNLLKFSETAQMNKRVTKPTSMATEKFKRGRAAGDGKPEKTGTSIFDPVLCELIYRWFVPAGGAVLDPFAGGSVRGIVAGKLGLKYQGVDLRKEQVEANRAQAQTIFGRPEKFSGVDQQLPVWHEGDSMDIAQFCAGAQADLMFSCPPYADLERYSDDARDISTMGYSEFLVAYRSIIQRAAELLKPDSFACFVVGEVRDEAGNYRNFVGETTRAFIDAGLSLYNEAILVTAIGSLPIRVGKQFGQYRKLGKTHQNVLVFVKGDWKAACAKLTAPDFGDPEDADDKSVVDMPADGAGAEPATAGDGLVFDGD